MRLFHARVLATVAVAAFGLAACGSSSKPSSSPATTAAPGTTLAPDTTTAAPTTTVAPAAATVTVATSAKLGKIVVDSKGMTLYRFDNDTAPGASTCTAAPCSTTWPAATVTGTPVAGAGVDDSKLSTFTTADGKKQLQMDGHPLYTFAGDAKAGDTNGQGILDKWYAVTPDGGKAGGAS
jgi:predicted lipoprotein with Yx(FWY)xxD motif